MFTATFVLSTGRCGTQWLFEKLKASYSDSLRVEHEPLHNRYEPRKMLGAKTPLALGSEASREILSHVEEIERGLETRSYLECGHPCWSSLPYLAERLATRIQIVHLVRHPIPTAVSWLTHAAFVPPFAPHLREKVLLSPFDQGVAFPEYQERWPSMRPFEKCLYYWAEVNAFGLRLETSLAKPWLRVSYEELFRGQGLKNILSFLGLVEREAIFQDRSEVVDQHRSVAVGGLPDLRVLEDHPAFVEVARQLGYDLLSAGAPPLRHDCAT